MKTTALQRNKTSFKGDVIRLATGTAVAQLVAILAAPILTRLFMPEAFGTAAVFASIVGVLSVLACMRYELTIVLPDDDQEAANLLAVSLLFVLLLTAVVACAMYFWGDTLSELLGFSLLKPYLWLVPIMVFLSGVFTALSYWNSRTKHFGRLAIAKVTQQLSSTVGSLSFGASGYTSAGTLILANLLGQGLATILLGRTVLKNHGGYLIKNINANSIIIGIKRYKKFPTLNSISALVNILSTTMPIFFLGIFFSPAIVGFFALAQRMLGMPLALLGNSISQVFLPRASDARHRGDLPSLLLLTFDKLILIGTLPLLVITIFAWDLVTFFFGANWVEAGPIIQVLIPWFYINFIGATFTKLVVILEKQEFGLYYNVALLITRFVMLSIGALFGSAILSVGLSAFFGAILLLVLCFYLIHQAGLHWRKLFHIMRFHGFTCLFALAIVGLFKVTAYDDVVKMVGSIFAIAVLYVTIIIWREPKLVASFLPQRLFRNSG